MVFEEYRFLRYFIPGSLYVIYTAIIILPNLANKVRDYLLQNGNVLLGVFAAAFAASPALGYIIYTFHDSFLYNYLAMKEWRPVLAYMREEINSWSEKTNEEKKTFLDTLYYFLGDRDAMNKEFSGTIRGIWSHFNARIVCSIWVPLFSSATVAMLFVIDQGILDHIFFLGAFDLFSIQIPYWVVAAVIIVVVSLVLVTRARRPYREATRLEYYFLRSKIESGTAPTKNRKLFEELAKNLLAASFPKKSSKK